MTLIQLIFTYLCKSVVFIKIVSNLEPVMMIKVVNEF